MGKGKLGFHSVQDVQDGLYLPRPVINEPPPLNRNYNRDPTIKAITRRGFMNQGSTLPEYRRFLW